MKQQILSMASDTI